MDAGVKYKVSNKVGFFAGFNDLGFIRWQNNPLIYHNNAVLTTQGWPMPAISGRTIGLDTISHGVLTAVRMPGGDIFQSARHRRRNQVSGRHAD